MSYIWSTTEEVTEALQKAFPGSTVEDMISYWDVTTQLVDYKVVDSYKLQNGKLVHFATLEMED
jgi:hypothetical protein